MLRFGKRSGWKFSRGVHLLQLSRDTLNSLVSCKPKVGLDIGLLVGTTYIAKDNIVTNHDLTTCGSKMLANYKSPFDATVVQLLALQGSQLVGKSNLDEFGMGSSTTNSYFGVCENPMYEEKHIAGGSSGGSAASVAANMADFSLGTDTGGSVRLPASYCKVIGFKPSYGRISRWGVVPYAQSLDTVGIMAKDMSIIEKVYNVLNQYDSKDPTSLDLKTRLRIPNTTKTSLTIGVPSQFIIQELSPKVRQTWTSTLCKLQDMGHQIRPVSLPSIKKLLLAYYTIVTAEAASNLSRYDGVRYGYCDDTIHNSPRDLVDENRSSFGPEVQRRIILGNYTLSSSSGDHLLKATQVRKKLVDEFNLVFNLGNVITSEKIEQQTDKCDIIISPTASSEPPTVEDFMKETLENFLNAYINDILTVPASLAGLPAISIPVGDYGIQIMGQFGDETTVLKLANDIVSK